MKEYTFLPDRDINAIVRQAADYNCPWVLYGEDIYGPPEILRWLDMEGLKKRGWFPWKVEDNRATIITCCRPTPELVRDIKALMGLNEVDFVFTNPFDLRRIVEHNQDLNPLFPPCAGRTPLAMTRTYFALRRSRLSLYRTWMAKSRTHLALVRTGFKFIAIALLFMRVFPPVRGSLTAAALILELPLLALGIHMIVFNMIKYLPARRISLAIPPYNCTTATGGTTVAYVENAKTNPSFHRTTEVPGAAGLRDYWRNLSPVMRRRFLASDRTDYAEERTTLACLRTWMANVRTWLAFVRTGGAFLGLGLGLIRAYPVSPWRFFDFAMVALGLIMISEGLFWYYRGHQAARVGYDSVKKMNAREKIWDFFFPMHHVPEEMIKVPPLPVHKGAAPGIWATTGLALERTLLADRRNLMARMRTVMARIRTGLSFIRTGLALFFIGLVFTVYFHKTNIFWYCYEISMMLGGLALIADGLFATVPAQKLRQQFPYCHADVRIIIPNYGVPCRFWKKAKFNRESR
ncbi:MAG: DUF202 domain-containing protein [Deltaproteobacteria bacterium]|nr:DUF202 domain-containing protein [Deltaproteobacteria bacterium]